MTSSQSFFYKCTIWDIMDTSTHTCRRQKNIRSHTAGGGLFTISTMSYSVDQDSSWHLGEKVQLWHLTRTEDGVWQKHTQTQRHTTRTHFATILYRYIQSWCSGHTDNTHQAQKEKAQLCFSCVGTEVLSSIPLKSKVAKSVYKSKKGIAMYTFIKTKTKLWYPVCETDYSKWFTVH